MKEPLSIYIHWPFCLSKCPYCDFNSHVSDKVDHNDWLKCYELELNHFKDTIGHKYIKSIFFGGGTPSLMKPFVVEGIISKIANLATIDEYTEITLETNPTSFETEKFKDFRLAGINRVSIGVQSLVENDLKSLGRQHDVGQAIKTIETARRIFPRISFDLIYARSNQTLKSWQDELTNAMQLASGHISLYQLVIEKGTLFYKLFNDGNLTIPSSDQAADQYEWTNLYLKSQGYFRYEISNYAILGHECKHNLTYWQYNNYLGIGPGSHSRVNMYDIVNSGEFGARNDGATPISNRRATSDNVHNFSSIDYSDFTSNLYSIMMWHKPEKWLQTVKSLGCGVQHINKLSMQEITEEMLMMGLRLEKGINIDLIQKRTSKQLFEILDIQKATYYKKLGLLQWDEELGDKGHINLTDKGLMLHSYIVPRLFSQ
ncbi:radical SAM family heme chaperone HemW [Rickettsia endosymbiont of Culicoides newsteadi]|uniref:radical SAM family heme chaperone HemW n=1 Tax=Rickettsia endosymbiont of Culicoides newsteadi TaxID=1961830 RepID=UPI000B9A37B6|nr:radical SAM family heme chaperone HemW [Rickettsia endosymbiont of Culicoides newsteadi]OZG31990.1 coproporphyrinogen III oxidase [Rickettsia endosymbiont of Culicoides newsteadi]